MLELTGSAAGHNCLNRETGLRSSRSRAMLVLCIGLVVSCGTFAQPPLCDAKRLKEVHKLAELPSGVQLALGVKGGAGQTGIAEPGAPYSSGDVPAYGLPDRQMILAGVDKRCVVVVYFMGGFVTTVQLLQFRLTDATWTAGKPQRLSDIPRSLNEAAVVSSLEANAASSPAAGRAGSSGR